MGDLLIFMSTQRYPPYILGVLKGTTLVVPLWSQNLTAFDGQIMFGGPLRSPVS